MEDVTQPSDDDHEAEIEMARCGEGKAPPQPTSERRSGSSLAYWSVRGMGSITCRAVLETGFLISGDEDALLAGPGLGLWGSWLSSKEADPRKPVRTLDRTPDLPTCGKNRRS